MDREGSETIELQLSERQRLAVVTAITIVSACVILAALGASVYLLSLFFQTFSSVFLPLMVAAFLALVVKPYYDWFTVRLKFPALLAVGVVFLSALIPVAAFSWFFGAIVVRQSAEMISKLPDVWAEAGAWAKSNAPRALALWEEYGLADRLEEVVTAQQEALLDGLQAVGTRALSAGAGVLRGLASLLGWVVLPVYFAFFLMVTPATKSFSELLPFLKEETRADVLYLVEQFVDIMVAFFRGQLLVALCQGVLFAIGFSFVGLNYGFVLGLVLGFLNIIPYLGSMVGLGVCLPLAFFQADGGLATLAWVIVVFTVVQLIESYVLTPRIMGARTGLHPLVIIVAIFFWGTAMGGITGMILAIPLTAFGVVFWRLAREKYIAELL